MQTFTDDCFAGGHQAQTDLQAFEDNFAALKSNFSGASAPANLVAGMIWADNSGSDVVLKVRNKLNNAWGTTGFPTGTVVVFGQAAAPVGWTQITTHNNKALRIVSGAGGGSGGTLGLSSPTVGDHVLSIAELASHSHTAASYELYVQTVGSGWVAYSRNSDGIGFINYTDGVGSNAGHNHPLNLAYVDVILASKD